jgi:imidazolonepropionase-like amidohydrolase
MTPHPFPHPARCFGACLALTLLLLVVPTHAQDADDLPVVTRTLAITNARVVVAPGSVMDDATVLVRDGLIEAVGPDVTVPYDARTVDGDSLTVYAGFIDGLSHAGVETPDLDTSEDIQNPDDAPPARAGILPHREARAFLAPDASDVSALRETGFTTAHVVPEGQMLPGRGALVQLAGSDPNAMLLNGAASVFFQIKGAQSSWPNVVAPSTDMAVIATMRDLMRETERRAAMRQAYTDGPAGLQRPPTDPVHDALAPVVDGSLPVAAYTEDALDLHRALGLQRELGVPMMLTGLSGSFRAIPTLQEADLPLFLTLDLPEAPDDESEEADTTAADEAPTEATAPDDSFFASNVRVRSYEDIDAEEQALQARQDQERAKYYQNAAALHEAGLRFGFTTKDASARDVRANLRTMMEHGLPEEAALAALTTDAATLLGVDEQLGTVEAGKIANLVLTDGNYFAEDTAVRHVMVDGHLFEVSTAEDEGEVTGSMAAVVGTWEYTIESPQGELSGTIMLEESGSGLDGTISSPTGQGDEDLQSISFDGASLSFSFDGGDVGDVDVSVTVDGSDFEGSVSTGQFGSFPITGTRTDAPE